MSSEPTPSKQAAFDRYAKLVKRLSPKSKLGSGCLRAFWVGGAICVIGQLISDSAHIWLNLTSEQSATVSGITLIFLSALLTALGVYDRVAQYAGAGALVPITGFANAMVSPAIEYRPEGFVLGVGAKLFSIAGPVLVYGIGASVIVGLISLWIDLPM